MIIMMSMSDKNNGISVILVLGNIFDEKFQSNYFYILENLKLDTEYLCQYFYKT